MSNSEVNPGTKSAFSFATSLPVLAARAQVNQVKGIQPQKGSGAGLPLHVNDIQASVANAVAGTTCTVTIQFKRNPADSAFSAAKVYVKGYQGNQSPTFLTAGSDSPVKLVLGNTGE